MTLDDMIADHVDIKQPLLQMKDQIFTKHFRLRHKISRTQYVSIAFEKFIRGITYFYHPTDRIVYPIYHRLASCGPVMDQTYDTFHRCYTSNPNNEEAKKRIWTCYIERLIYDCMIKDMTLHMPSKGTEPPQQDRGHREWLRKTKADFRTCYPNTTIHVTIPRYESGVPCELSIVVKRHRTIIERLHFVRNLQHLDVPMAADYDPIVECHRYIGYKHYFKVQEFYTEVPWDSQSSLVSEVPLDESLSTSSESKRKAQSLTLRDPVIPKQLRKVHSV